MAYVIPVAALVLDHAAAAAALNLPADFFDNPRNDRYPEVERLATLTGAPVQEFCDESQDIYYLGIHLEEDWRIDIDSALIAKSMAAFKQYDHPLIQGARLAVVSTFC